MMSNKHITSKGHRLLVSDSVGNRILKFNSTKFSCGASAENFRDGDFAYFGKACYTIRGNQTKYLADVAIRRYSSIDITTGETVSGFCLSTRSGSYGSGGLQQAARYTFSRRVLKQIAEHVETIIDGIL